MCQVRFSLKTKTNSFWLVAYQVRFSLKTKTKRSSDSLPISGAQSRADPSTVLAVADIRRVLRRLRVNVLVPRLRAGAALLAALREGHLRRAAGRGRDGLVQRGDARPPRMLNTRGVSSFND